MSTSADRAQVELATRRVEAAVSAAWQAGVSTLNARNIQDAISSGGVEAVEPAIRQAVDVATGRLRQTLPRIVREVMRQAATTELPSLRQSPSALQDETEFPDLADPDDSGDLPIVSDLDLREIGFDAAGETIVEEQVEQLATELGDSMTAGLLLLIGLGVVAGVSAGALAQRIRLGLGLRPDQARAVANLARELATSNPGRLVTRFRPLPGVRTRPGFAVRIPANVTPAWIESQLHRYIPMLLRSRARLVGRTISVTAWERGRALLWTLALRSGLLPQGAARVWRTAGDDRVCPRCVAMEGQIAPIGQPFTSPDVGNIQSAPLHPRCRCRAVLIVGRILTTNRSIDRKEQLITKAKKVFRKMITGVAGEGADAAAWHAANEANCKCAGKSQATKPTPVRAPDPERQERQRILARLKSMTPSEQQALHEKVKADWLAGHAPPDSYAAALEQLRNEYGETGPTTYQELDR